jgi:hypothetical protein
VAGVPGAFPERQAIQSTLLARANSDTRALDRK